MSTSYLRLTTVWFDEDLLELELKVVNERFEGRTNFYAELDAAKVLADRFEGFPTSLTDTRLHEFGQTDLSGYGSASITLSNQDSTGHLLARTELTWAPISTKDISQSAVIRLNCSPAEIDSFVQQLRSMSLEIGQSASLWGVA